MNVIFLNTFQKILDENHSKNAQVLIGENEGQWLVVWKELQESREINSEIWFEGDSWDEASNTFRQQLKKQILNGFKSKVVLDHEFLNIESKSKKGQLLYYYCTLYPNDQVFEELRKWRRELSNKEEKAPYLLATNRMLRMVSVFLPHTAEEMKSIPGYGEHKSNLYHHDILKITTKYAREENFPLDWVTSRIDYTEFETWLTEQKKRRVQLEIERDENKRKLLEYVTKGNTFDEIESILTLPRREIILWIEELDRERYDVLPWVLNELQSISEEDQQKAWESFEVEGDRYLKPVLLRTFTSEELENKQIEVLYEWLRLLRIKYKKHQETENKPHTDPTI